MQCLVVIPARGGSRGVPRKNVRLLAGKPLIAHAIAAALAARRVTRVVVSTDDSEIAALSAQHGAEVVLRPSELSGDTASSESALLHVLDVLDERERALPELVVLMQCTSPLTTAEDLDGLLQRLEDTGADSAFTAVPFFHFLWRADEQGTAHGINHAGSKRQRRQDMSPQFLENGAAYAMRTDAFRKSGERFVGRVVMHVCAAERCLEIDEPADFEQAEQRLRAQQRDRQRALLPRGLRALVLDFDGVLTDNRVTLNERGEESAVCDRGDGTGLALVRARGIELLILSKEQNRVVQARADKLGIACLHGVDDKLPALHTWLASKGLTPSDAIYVGNDVNDVACMRAVACSAAPSDAHESALAAAQLVLTRPGGHGAVRELCDMLLARLDEGEL